ncbi:MAG TPA: ABC transporter permease [Thermoanaerobaculia bacterium]|nr:ABC transporter permease [Thermoanaerobaculia bacterium]
MIDALVQSLPLAVVASVPLLLAVQGELVVQRAGMINLGLEGMMLTAAMSAVVAAVTTGSIAAGFAGGVAGAFAVALLFGLFAIRLRADQIVTGTAINLLALGVTGFVYHEFRDSRLFTGPLPAAGSGPFVIAAWIVAPLVVATLLWRTSFGLRLRACGENPAAVAANGAGVARHRLAALALEALLAGCGGAYLSLLLSNGFAENMTAGRGFIALAIVIFGRWKVSGAVAGTALFGAAAAIQYAIQAGGSGVPFHLLLAVPYLVTLAILAGVTGHVRAPASLGR